MAFDFNNLANSVSKSVSKIGQEASNVTKNVTGTVKYNSIISDQRKIIQATYADIGKKYYEKHCKEENSEYSEEISRIKAAFDQIEYCERQQMELKGEAFCKNCGAKLKQGASFCVMCGAKTQLNNASNTNNQSAPVQHDTAQEVQDQPSGQQAEWQEAQGQTTEQGAQEQSSGQQAEWQEAQAQTTEQNSAVQEVHSQTSVQSENVSSEINVCPRCNNPVNSDMVFCTNCGNKLK